MGCTSAAGPIQTPSRLHGDPLLGPSPMQTLTEEWEQDCFSQSLCGEGKVNDRHTLPRNAPCYLRRCEGVSNHQDSFCGDTPGSPGQKLRESQGEPEGSVKGETGNPEAPSDSAGISKNRN